MGIFFRQFEISSHVHRLGKVFVTECKVVNEEESDEIDGSYVLKQRILDHSHWLSRQVMESGVVMSMLPWW